jgi:hypothetical protein
MVTVKQSSTAPVLWLRILDRERIVANPGPESHAR